MDDKKQPENDFIEALPPDMREQARQMKLAERLKTASSKEERDDIADELAASSARERMREANITKPVYTVIGLVSMLMYALGLVMLLAVPFYEPATLLHATCLFVVGFCLNAFTEGRDSTVQFISISESLRLIDKSLRNIEKYLAAREKNKSSPTDEM